MKKILLFLMLTGMFISCGSNDDDPEETIIVEEVTINNSETFQYSLGYFGIEEGAYIQKQPGNSELSEIIRNDASGDLIYRYKSQDNFKGRDYVEIWTGRGSDGASPSTRIEIIKITFNILD